jgi:hypothetical protein
MNPEEVKSDSAHNYLPLVIGNKWQYTYYRYHSAPPAPTVRQYGIRFKEVIGDTVISGNVYFIMNENENINFYRYSDDNKLFQWIESSSSECLFMDFNLEGGVNFASCSGGSRVNEGYENQFGSIRKSKGFFIPGIHGADGPRYIDSIGYWRYDSNWGFYNGYELIQIVLINAIVTLEDSTFNYSYYYQPDILFSPDSTVDTLLLKLDFQVDHTYSKFSSNGESRNFIDKVWIEYFYAKQDSSTKKDSILANISINSILCNASISLDSLKFSEGFKFYYAIHAIDKALIPQFARSPEIDYFELSYDPNPVSVNQEKEAVYSFTLSQNYPNPFNPASNIGFTISDFGFVSLKVYDVLGNEIATLVNEEKPAGNFEAEFNGRGLPSGIYFYQLKINNYIETKKMILLK